MLSMVPPFATESEPQDAVSTIEAAGGICVVLDVNDLESIPFVINTVLKRKEKSMVLVNNAGIWPPWTLEDLR